MRTQTPTELDPVLTQTVRRLYVRPVDPDRARRDVATIAEAALVADQNRGPAAPARAASPARRRRMPLWRPALAAVAALIAIPAGMAAAGVEVPAPLEAPYDLVGITLPNQAADQAREATQKPRPTARGRSAQTPAATTPGVTAPGRTSSSVATRAERREQAERARRAQRATPAVPATPAEPSGKGGGAATPATPATPAQPVQPAGAQDRSARTQPETAPLPKTALPRSTRSGRGRGLDRSQVE